MPMRILELHIEQLQLWWNLSLLAVGLERSIKSSHMLVCAILLQCWNRRQEDRFLLEHDLPSSLEGHPTYLHNDLLPPMKSMGTQGELPLLPWDSHYTKFYLKTKFHLEQVYSIMQVYLFNKLPFWSASSEQPHPLDCTSHDFQSSIM